MMGGLMSTRWGDHRKRGVVEDCLVIDAHELARQGRRATLLSYHGHRLFFIRYCIESAPGDGEPFQVTLDLAERAGIQVVPIEITHPHFGGMRWWFNCPQCAKRCKKLYLPPRQWEIACRLCHNLTYTSSQAAHTLSGDQQVQSVRKCCAGLITRVCGKDAATDLIEHLRRMR
jgi:hypothetical protein